MSGKHSIQNTKEVLVLAFKAGEAVKKSMADGKIDLNDSANIFPVIPTLAPAFQDISSIPSELVDLDSAEIDELQKLILDEVGSLVAGEKLVNQINLGLKAIKANYEFYLSLK